MQIYSNSSLCKTSFHSNNTYQCSLIIRKRLLSKIARTNHYTTFYSSEKTNKSFKVTKHAYLKDFNLFIRYKVLDLKGFLDF